MNKNIRYQTKQITDYYSSHRRAWKELYPSEQWVFEKIANENGGLGDVLDVGCACGGLSVALQEKNMLSSYTGIDIHEEAIGWAGNNIEFGFPVEFIAGDIIELELSKQYDTVISLGCADWNVESRKIIDACWKNVKAGGNFIISLRLTPGEGINNIKKSYQTIIFSGREDQPEKANYVVFNVNEAVRMLRLLDPSPDLIGCYGYWGKPSSTAVTPYKRLIFAVFYIKKRTGDYLGEIRTDYNLPKDIFLKC